MAINLFVAGWIECSNFVLVFLVRSSYVTKSSVNFLDLTFVQDDGSDPLADGSDPSSI